LSPDPIVWAAIVGAGVALLAAIGALAARGVLSGVIAASVASAMLAAAFAAYGAAQTALFAAAAGALWAVTAIAAWLLAPDCAEGRHSPVVSTALIGLGAAILTYAMADAPSPAAHASAAPGADPLDALVAVCLFAVGGAAANALLGQGERSVLGAPSGPRGAFPGREHAVARGVGKGLSPLLAVAALAVGAQYGVGAAVAAGALLALALALYALVFGLDAAVAIAPPAAVGGLGALGLALAFAGGFAPLAWGGSPFVFVDAPRLGPASGAVIAEGAFAAAAIAAAFGAGSVGFYALAGRAQALPDEPAAPRTASSVPPAKQRRAP